MLQSCCRKWYEVRIDDTLVTTIFDDSIRRKDRGQKLRVGSQFSSSDKRSERGWKTINSGITQMLWILKSL